MNMIRYVPIITAFLKRPLMLAALVCLLSCGGRQEATPPAGHARQADSLVAACKGLEALQDLLARFEAVHDDRGRMRALTEIGKIHRESSDFSTAVNLHEEALTLAREQKDTANIIYILNQLGTDFRRLGMLDEAAVRHYEALSHCEAFSDRSSARALKSRAVSLNGIGNLQLTLQNNDVAESIFRQALAVEQSLKSHLGQAINYANIGYIKEACGERDSAWIYYGYSMEQNRLADSRLGVSLCYNHFGRLAEQMGDYRKALESYLSAYDLMADDKDRWHWLESCLSIAQVYLATGQGGQARTYLDEGLKTATEINSWEHQAEAYRLKALFDEANGHYRAALDNHRKYKAYTDSLTNEKKINRLNNLRLKYITEKGNKEKEIISQAYNDEQQQKQIILYSLITVILVSAAAISLLIYALRVKAKMQIVIKKASRARQEFFTNVTHEFRTPLTVILGSAQELKAKTRTPSVELDAISRQGQRLLTLVNQLLDIAKVRSAIGKADWKTGNIVVFIQMVVENVSLQATRNRVEVGYRPEEKEVNMDFVPDFMYKILTNLLYNALKFTPQGGRISIRSRVAGKSIRISVEDTGCGIKPDDLPRIFEPFFQSDSHKDAGTGIGLALTKQMTEAMGGRIEVSSRQGEGTLFSLSIPIRNSGDRLEKFLRRLCPQRKGGAAQGEGVCAGHHHYRHHDARMRRPGDDTGHPPIDPPQPHPRHYCHGQKRRNKQAGRPQLRSRRLSDKAVQPRRTETENLQAGCLPQHAPREVQPAADGRPGYFKRAGCAGAGEELPRGTESLHLVPHLAFQSELRNDCKNDVPEQIPTQPESEVADRHEYLVLHQAIEAGPCPDVPEGSEEDNRGHRHDVRFRIGQLLHQDVQGEIRHHSVGI